MPAGAAMHFWDALNAASIPSLANGRGRPPREETASTMTDASTACAASTIGLWGHVLPDDGSLRKNGKAFPRGIGSSLQCRRTWAFPPVLTAGNSLLLM